MFELDFSLLAKWLYIATAVEPLAKRLATAVERLGKCLAMAVEPLA